MQLTLCSCILQIWKSKTDNQWTPLNGQGRLKVLSRLKWSDVDELVEGKVGDGVKKLWKVYHNNTYSITVTSAVK